MELNPDKSVKIQPKTVYIWNALQEIVTFLRKTFGNIFLQRVTKTRRPVVEDYT